jgi:SAM-dependent methyltransferase
VIYQAKVKVLQSPLGHRAARVWRQTRSGVDRARSAADYMRGRVEGRSVADVGCMWKIAGGHSFLAETLGATRVVAVDTWKAPEFDEARAARRSNVEFVEADATECGALAKLVGPVDLVWCFGVLYHVPDPLQLLRNLREICGEQLVLETTTIPEVPGMRQAACFFPYLPRRGQAAWRDRRNPLGHQISKDYDSAAGYDNNFWSMTPSAVEAALRVAGFRPDHHEPSTQGTLRTVFFASPLPDSDGPSGTR